MDTYLNSNGQLIPDPIDLSKVVFDESDTDRAFRNATFMEESPHKPLFVGRLSHLPKIDFKGDYSTTNEKWWSNYKEYNYPKIEISVDTNQIMRHSTWRHVNFNSTRINEWVTDSVQFKAYPVYIKNFEADTVEIGHGALLDIYLEALDRNGNWKNIHHPRFYSCGVGVYEILLAPSHYALTSTPLYVGGFKTKLRLKLASYPGVYSNVFTALINESQFEPRPGYEYHMNLLTKQIYWKDIEQTNKTE